jgi:hypothetical protein
VAAAVDTLQEEGGEHHELPVHHKAEEYLDAYIKAAGITDRKGTPLWRCMTKERGSGDRRMSRQDVFRLVNRRREQAKLRAAANCHTFRATRITVSPLKSAFSAAATAPPGRSHTVSLADPCHRGQPLPAIGIKDSVLLEVGIVSTRWRFWIRLGEDQGCKHFGGYCHFQLYENDLKSSGAKAPCGFESRPRHQ